MFDMQVVLIGGGIGASLRYLACLASNKYWGTTYRATFAVNILGCLFLGFVSTLVFNNTDLFDPNLKLFLCAGVAGGFTTFSTFSYENIALLKDGKIFQSLIYMASSLIFGFFAIYCGFLLAAVV